MEREGWGGDRGRGEGKKREGRLIVEMNTVHRFEDVSSVHFPRTFPPRTFQPTDYHHLNVK